VQSRFRSQEPHQALPTAFKRILPIWLADTHQAVVLISLRREAQIIFYEPAVLGC
jgi:hypothetical protein